MAGVPLFVTVYAVVKDLVPRLLTHASMAESANIMLQRLLHPRREERDREREGRSERGREAERQRGREAEGERERETASEHCGPPEVVLSCEVCVWVPLMVCA